MSEPDNNNAPARPAPATLVLATCNTLNLANAGREFYPNQEPYGAEEHRRKVAWLGGMVKRLNADVLALQEVWDESALREVVIASGLRYATVAAPGAEQGAQGTPRVALATRWPVLSLESHHAFAEGQAVTVPEIGEQRAFERPILEGLLQMPGERGTMRVLVAHLKSKRPKFLQDAAGQPLEDRDDPLVVARATLRSLVMRAAECAALRAIVHQRLSRTREPLVLMGDLNDSPHAVTTQMVAATQAIAYDRAARDTALFHAPDVQSDAAIRRDVAYSHVHQGWPEVLDQIWVSEEFVASSRFAIGDLRRVDYFNDHLHEGRDRVKSDHGVARALVLLR
jgi:endonuclease/exonuclease/phosphatase family metal-dependent hydrolase